MTVTYRCVFGRLDRRRDSNCGHGLLASNRGPTIVCGRCNNVSHRSRCLSVVPGYYTAKSTSRLIQLVRLKDSRIHRGVDVLGGTRFLFFWVGCCISFSCPVIVAEKFSRLAIFCDAKFEPDERSFQSPPAFLRRGNGGLSWRFPGYLASMANSIFRIAESSPTIDRSTLLNSIGSSTIFPTLFKRSPL